MSKILWNVWIINVYNIIFTNSYNYIKFIIPYIIILARVQLNVKRQRYKENDFFLLSSLAFVYSPSPFFNIIITSRYDRLNV